VASATDGSAVLLVDGSDVAAVGRPAVMVDVGADVSCPCPHAAAANAIR
jgi:hypothetical protein